MYELRNLPSYLSSAYLLRCFFLLFPGTISPYTGKPPAFPGKVLFFPMSGAENPGRPYFFPGIFGFFLGSFNFFPGNFRFFPGIYSTFPGKREALSRSRPINIGFSLILAFCHGDMGHGA
jgi:hypothetical protein